MTTILIILAFVICTALLFWLDRKDKEDKEKEEKIDEGVFDLLSKLSWNSSRHQMDGKLPEMEFLDLEEQGKLDCINYRHKFNEDFIVSFYFLKEKSGSLLGADFYLPRLSRRKLDAIYSRLCKKYGEPVQSGLVDENSLEWHTGDSVLVLETTDSGNLVLGFWNKEFYQSQSEG
ncbi:MAG TPA: hypothetical protein VNN20_06815 [Thermodesulfobacteriota bacterium]|nr:hypothetical protein [Thermodesulfobacteriota bacterium]